MCEAFDPETPLPRNLSYRYINKQIILLATLFVVAKDWRKNSEKF